MSDAVHAKIRQDIEQNPIVLFMKGSKSFPQCGFSAQVLTLLAKYKVAFETRNVLEDEALRQGIKEFSSWPTVPQLYVRGKFVGGSDIVTDLDQKGELEALLKGTK